jgi:hypothetical protein
LVALFESVNNLGALAEHGAVDRGEKLLRSREN